MLSSIHKLKKTINRSIKRNIFTIEWNKLKKIHLEDGYHIKSEADFNPEYLDILKNSVRTKEREDFFTVLSVNPPERKQGFPAHARLFYFDSVNASSINEMLEKSDLSKLGRLYIPKTDKIGQDIHHVIEEEENKGLPEFSLLHIMIPTGTFLARDRNNRPFLLEGSQIDMSSQVTPVTDRIKLFHAIARNTFYKNPNKK